MSILTMNNKFSLEISLLALVATMAITLSGCATTGTTTGQPAAEPLAEVEEPIEPWDGDGMDIPSDGSSLKAFHRYLARVKAHTDPSHYTTLVNAIDYLLVYDLGAKRDKATLVSRLDGLTGWQIIDKVSWQKK